MREFLASWEVRVVLSLTLLSVLIVVGYYVVRRFRDRIDQDEPTPDEWLTNFREMRESGDISDFEYRRVRTVLGDKLDERLNNRGDES